MIYITSYMHCMAELLYISWSEGWNRNMAYEKMCFLHLWTCLIVNQILFHWEVFICTMELENIPNLTSDVHHRLDQKALNSADILWTITASAIIFMSTGIGVKKGQDLKPHLLIIIIFHDQCSLIVSFYT